MRSRPALLAALLLAVLAAGCGGGAAEVEMEAVQGESTPSEPSPSGPALPATVTDASGGEVIVTDVSRIVSLTGSATEVVDALGLFDNLVGVDQSAIYPPRAAELPQIGYQRTLAAEGILALNPTLILGTSEAGPPEVIEQLRGSGVPTVILEFDESLDTPAAKVRDIAEVLGVPEEGERVAAEAEREIAEALESAEVAGPGPRTAFVYYRGPETVLLGGAGTVSQTMIEAAGGFDAGAQSGVQGTVPLTPEALAAAAPDVLVFPQRGLEAAGGAEGALALPGVAQTPAGQNGRIVGIDDQALLGLGPRTGAALAELVEALHGGAA